MTVDTAAVAAAWPSDREAPSARAITERLVRIRKNAGVHFAVRSAQNKSAGEARSAPSTPKKPKLSGSQPTTPSNGSAAKRKRKGVTVKPEVIEVDDDAADNELGGGTSVAKDVQHEFVAGDFGNNGDGTELTNDAVENDDVELDSPTKRLRVDDQPFNSKYSYLTQDEDSESEYEGV